MDFAGTWHIYEMETWDEDYFNMEVQAYVRIEPNGRRFKFTWEGNDECDPASGSGWVRIKENDVIEGEFRIHNSDSSTFLARKAY